MRHGIGSPRVFRMSLVSCALMALVAPAHAQDRYQQALEFRMMDLDRQQQEWRTYLLLERQVRLQEQQLRFQREQARRRQQ